MTSVKLRLTKQQRGQAMVLTMAFIVVVLLGTLVLFNTGQLTRQKMEVQNAADAAAYSAALLYARQLNFMAYTNRAMIANEAAIGQLFAFTSWKAKYALGKPKGTWSLIATEQALKNLLRSLFNAIFNAIIPGGGAAIAESLANGITIVIIQFITSAPRAANVVSKIYGTVMAEVGKRLMPFFSNVNKAYGFFNTIMRVATMTAQVQMVPELINANAKGAKLSNFGALAMVLSIAEQHQNFLYKAAAKNGVDEKAKKRYVALVNDARDGWTRDRRRTDLIASTGFSTSVPNPLPIGGPTLLEFNMNLDAGWPNDGGTALRLLGKKEEPAWSSVDTIGFGLDGGFETCVFGSCSTIPLDWLQVSEGGASAELTSKSGPTLGEGRLDKWREAEYGGVNWNTVAAIDAINPRAAKGGYQGATKKHAGIPDFYDIDPANYGGADKSPVFLIGVRKDTADLHTSDKIASAPLGQFAMKTRGVGYLNDAYEGNMEHIVEDHFARFLRDYIDEKLPVPDLPSVPGVNINQRIENFIDSLVGDVSKIIGDLADVVIEPVEETIGSNQPAMFALAAARVYYKNPQDDSEVGSTFNPYWEVRLQPVDDNVRKWALVSQDPEFRNGLAYLTFKSDFTAARKETSGMDGNLGDLETFIGEPGNR